MSFISCDSFTLISLNSTVLDHKATIKKTKTISLATLLKVSSSYANPINPVSET